MKSIWISQIGHQEDIIPRNNDRGLPEPKQAFNLIARDLLNGLGPVLYNVQYFILEHLWQRRYVFLPPCNEGKKSFEKPNSSEMIYSLQKGFFCVSFLWMSEAPIVGTSNPSVEVNKSVTERAKCCPQNYITTGSDVTTMFLFSGGLFVITFNRMEILPSGFFHCILP